MPIATSMFDATLGVLRVGIARVFALGLSGRSFRAQVDVPQAVAIAVGLVLLGLGRLLDSDVLALLGLVGVVVSSFSCSEPAGAAPAERSALGFRNGPDLPLSGWCESARRTVVADVAASQR